jgi:RNA polymerase sigma-70 factor (ECF subfamily)
MPTGAHGRDGGEDRARRFERIAEAAGPRLYRLARGMLGDHHGAQDAVQEALCRYWTAPPEGEGPVAHAWLRRVVVNHCLTRLRRAGPRSLDRIEAPDERPAGRPAPEGIETYKRILAAMAELPEAQRAVLSLRVFEQLGYQQIAGLLDCPVGTVLSRMHRARQTLIGRLTTLGLLGGEGPQGYMRCLDLPSLASG